MQPLISIKAFRPGNVDLPTNLAMPAAGALTVADKISDPMMPELDPSLLDFRPRDTTFGYKKDDPLVWNSQIVSEPSIETGRAAPARDERGEFGDDDMNIDLDLDLGADDEPTNDIGRDVSLNTSMQHDFVADDMSPRDLGFEDPTRTRLSSQVPSLVEDRDDQLQDGGEMQLDNDDEIVLFANDDAIVSTTANLRLSRDSQSPLSSISESRINGLDAAHINDEDEEEVSMRQATHKAKKRKVLPSDAITMLTSDMIKKQQIDRSAILRPTSFLPRDPVLLNLMNMQKNGGFASSLMGGGQFKGLAPELRGILSIEVVRKSGELKRKRDSGVADVSENDVPADGEVQLEIPDDETYGQADEGVAADISAPCDTFQSLQADEGFHSHHDDADIAGRDEGEDDSDIRGPNFDETTAPLLHPMEQGAVSQGTKHAVHLLRDRFGASVDGSPSQTQKKSILFQELLPERSTSKADATKMFFETLVLATKDAIKVEQADKEVGANIRVRAKRGLWGAWAEKEAGGEIAQQEPAGVTVASAS